LALCLAALSGSSLLFGFGCRSRSAPTSGSAAARSSAALDPKKAAIVLLGSSTSAGTGPKDPDNAWAARYADYLAQRFPDFQLVNLAVGGQTTYHIQPTGFVPPPNRPAPAPEKNITAALALGPRGVIVNMPSNDSAENVPAPEQLQNLERVASLAEARGIPLWVSTTQPRNFSDEKQRTTQSLVRDQIQARFAPRVLDFWKPFATSEHTIKPEFDAGDGVHLNDAAHSLLVDIVIAAHIPETIRSVLH
jgi:lysophospholipase L1-like esterase